MFKSRLKVMQYMTWKLLDMRFQFCGHRDAWHIATHLTRHERLALYKTGLACPPGATFLEIGSYLGASSCFLAAAASEIGKGAKVHCIDTWRNDAMSEGPRDTWPDFLSNVKKYHHVIIPHRGESTEIAHFFTGEIDLLFVDGDHSYEACRNDVESWLPRLKRQGIIMMHDSGWATGVISVIREMVAPLAESEERLPNLYWARLP
jgi:predicted O-methyltransferase YrrM